MPTFDLLYYSLCFKNKQSDLSKMKLFHSFCICSICLAPCSRLSHLHHVSICFGFSFFFELALFLKLEHISLNGDVLGCCNAFALVGHRNVLPAEPPHFKEGGLVGNRCIKPPGAVTI